MLNFDSVATVVVDINIAGDFAAVVAYQRHLTHCPHVSLTDLKLEELARQ